VLDRVERIVVALTARDDEHVDVRLVMRPLAASAGPVEPDAVHVVAVLGDQRGGMLRPTAVAAARQLIGRRRAMEIRYSTEPKSRAGSEDMRP
jgi:hypothetical protein